MRAEQVDARLCEWAQWVALGAGGGDGYPHTNVLHESWSPARGQMQASALVARSDARERAVADAVRQLSTRLRDTVCVHYCKRLAVTEQAALLGCAVSTVHARVREAQRLVGELLLGVVPASMSVQAGSRHEPDPRRAFT